MIWRLFDIAVGLSQIGAFLWIVFHTGAATNAPPAAARPSPVISGSWVLVLAGALYVVAMFFNWKAAQARRLSASTPQTPQQGEPIWWLFGIGKRLHQQEREIESLRRDLNERNRQHDALYGRAQGVGAEVNRLAGQLKEKDETIRRQQEQILSSSQIRETRNRGNALLREGNLLLDQVNSIGYDDVPSLSDPVKRWARQVYDFANRPPLIAGSEIIAGLNLEPGTVSEKRSQILEGMIRAGKPEEERQRLQYIIDHISTRLSERLARLPVV